MGELEHTAIVSGVGDGIGDGAVTEVGAIEKDPGGDLGVVQLDRAGYPAVGEPQCAVDPYPGGAQAGERGRAQVEPADFRVFEVGGHLEVAGDELDRVREPAVPEIETPGDPGTGEVKGGCGSVFRRPLFRRPVEQRADELRTDRTLLDPGTGRFPVSVAGRAQIDRLTADEALLKKAFRRGRNEIRGAHHARDTTAPRPRARRGPGGVGTRPERGGDEAGTSREPRRKTGRCQCRMACSGVMDKQQFWQLIETAREQVPAPEDSRAVARRASELLAARPAEDIVAAQQTLWDLMAESYTNQLWAAAYLANGGCSDDGFDYFRGWLLAQGRQVFERVVADPDALADLPVVRTSAADGSDLDCEAVLGIVWDAHMKATGEQLPADSFSIRFPELDPTWDFDNHTEMGRRLPRLAALHLA